MKVKKAIELLEKENTKAKIKLHYKEGDKIANVLIRQGANPIVYLVDESECNSNKTIETVEEILDELKQCNPEAELRLHLSNSETALFVVSYTQDTNNVWLECESDNDMYSEISGRFETAVEEGLDELDVYMDMLEIGIDVDMVRRWMDDETADHMEQFCKEHGLL